MRRNTKYGRCVAICSGCEKNTKVFENMTYEEAKNLRWYCTSCSAIKLCGGRTPVESRLASMGLLPAKTMMPVYTRLENNFVVYNLESKPTDLDFELDFVKTKTLASV